MRYLREGGLVTQTSYRCHCQNYIFSTDLVLHVLSDTDTILKAGVHKRYYGNKANIKKDRKSASYKQGGGVSAKTKKTNLFPQQAINYCSHRGKTWPKMA